MREQWNRQQRTAVVVVIAMAFAAGVYLLRRESGPSTGELSRYLPREEGLRLEIDLSALRATPWFEPLAGQLESAEADYRSFVAETGFDFRTDLDRAAGLLLEGRTYLVLAGRFDWTRLRRYAAAQGGSCAGSFCEMPGSSPQRRIGFTELRSGVMAFASGPEAGLVAGIRDSGVAPVGAAQSILRFEVPGSRFSSLFPVRAQSVLAPVQALVFTIPAQQREAVLQLRMVCADASAAQQIHAGFRQSAETLLNPLSRTSGNPQGFAAILASGRFSLDGAEVTGEWTIPPQFLAQLRDTRP
jgi:hypothetical protein